jgi:hypothetical protein
LSKIGHTFMNAFGFVAYHWQNILKILSKNIFWNNVYILYKKEHLLIGITTTKFYYVNKYQINYCTI